MPLINKILFPVDFSSSCAGAARYVEAMAGRFEASILLLHVVGMGDGGLTLAEELLPLRQEKLNAFLADELKYFDTERLCVTGDEPALEIGAVARLWRPDLVMIPTHGVGAFRRLLLGSVTEKVLTDLEGPVWTTVHSEAAPPLEQIHCRRILCAVDLTERSERVVKWASALAAEYDAALGIVHAATELAPAFVSVGLEQELGQSASKQARRKIGKLEAAAGTTAKIFTGVGDPAKVVAGVANEFKADLLVIGRHESKGFLHQNAYSILRDSPCPVISV